MGTVKNGGRTFRLLLRDEALQPVIDDQMRKDLHSVPFRARMTGQFLNIGKGYRSKWKLELGRRDTPDEAPPAENMFSLPLSSCELRQRPADILLQCDSYA